MAIEYDIDDLPGRQKVVIKHPSRHVVESQSEERHRIYNPANESPAQRAQAGSASACSDDSSPVGLGLSSSSSSLSSGWDFVQVSEALPSLTTSARSIETAVQSQHAPENNEQGEPQQDLTTSTLLAFDEHNKLETGAKASMEAKKGTATRASDDSDEPMGPWVPGEGYHESAVSAAGSWTYDIPRYALELEDDISLL